MPRRARRSDYHKLTLHSTSYFRLTAANEHVHFAADAKILQVNAGLNGEAAIRQDPTLIVDLKVIHVSAAAVDLNPDGVPGSMDEVVAVSSLDDGLSNRIIHLPAANLFSCSNRVTDELDPRIASVAHDSEDLAHAI